MSQTNLILVDWTRITNISVDSDFSLERMDLAVKNPINAVPAQLDILN